MRIIADFHIHSKYSRATSKEMMPEVLAKWANWKGINLLGTGDCTHPAWVKELKEKLEEAEEGLFKIRGEKDSPRFIISGEISSIYTQGGKGRRVHTVFTVPSWKSLDKINQEIARRGGNLLSDGRPIVGISAKDLAGIILGADENCLVIPAHIWTPWFSLFGSKSGFDSIEECYEELAPNIYAVETGLSSDPPMNWRVKDLDNVALISNSDAHSPANLMREANVFDLPKLSYCELVKAIKEKDKDKFLYTIEFFPEEGKYHWDGNRQKGISLSPEETHTLAINRSPLVSKLTIGVEHRVFDLANRPAFISREVDSRLGEKEMAGKPVSSPEWGIPYVSLVPLREIIAESIGVGVNAGSVQKEYFRIILEGGSEFAVLMDKTIEELELVAGKRVAEGIRRVREGKVSIKPGYDGVYGEVRVFEERKTNDLFSRQRKLF